MGEEIFMDDGIDSATRGTTFIKRTHEVLKDLGSVVGSDLGSFKIAFVNQDGTLKAATSFTKMESTEIKEEDE